jgi:adenosine deaminase
MTSGLADLHRHLDGSLRPATVAELAGALGLEVPPDLPFFPGMGLQAALGRFAFTLSLLQSEAAVRRVAAEICEDAAAEGVTTLEIRFAPQLHGGSLEGIVDAALEGIDGRAGLILCGLYGEDPGLLSRLVRIAATRPGVVGLDLAGGPAPGHAWSMADYARPFRQAAELGLGRTVHAGEGRPPAEIRTAIEVLGANRVGHGTTLLDDPAVLELVLQCSITVEACLSSNWHVGALPHWSAHPLPRWLELGVRATVATDNTLLSAVDAPEELRRAATLLRPEQVASVIANGHAGAFRRGQASA